MQWYYLSDSHERVALSEAQFPVLAARGLLRPTTPVWRKGLADWIACGEVKPELFVGGIVRDSDQRGFLTDHTAIQGTVTGVARVLCEYRGWFWIAGGMIILWALAGISFLGWAAWQIGRFGVESLNRGFAFMDPLRNFLWIVVLLLALSAVMSLIAGWTGWLLIRSGIKAKQARESGAEHLLVGAVRDIGRYFCIVVVMILLEIIVWVSLGLWLGWDKAFPMPGPPPATKVSV
ncbi:MAG TPA: DUF4339 domain-containing protein [Verrucomicrobiales bacterium]|jgi:hypothetical protein|nr:DUF4339 domain-containing protein [Verrucomicrobiales bacterium]